MKQFILFASLLLAFTCSYAQKKGKNEILTYTTEDGTTYAIGDTVYLGMGSNTNGAFRYAIVEAGFFNAGQYFQSDMNGKFMAINKFRKEGNDKVGYSTLIIGRFGLITAAIQIESAITAGEVITPASKKKMEEKNKPVIIQQAGTSSIADELKKLKGLLDAGVLTQTEFDAQKAKLLAK